jgi:hypothetical protein
MRARALRLLPQILLVLVLPGAVAQAQGEVAAAGGSTVTITVHDSLASRPLPGATVQVVLATDPTAFSRSGDTDSLGRYVFAGIPAGRYTVGFMHPLLDTLGIAAPARALDVEPGRAARLELFVPSPTRLRAAICGPQAGSDSNAAIIGTVRDPRDMMPWADATVSGEWLEITFAAGSMRQRPARVDVTTGADGWFALCGLPSGTVTVTARHEGDSTHALEFALQPGDLRRRDLFVTTVGRGRLAGRIVGAGSGDGLGGAQVRIAGGASTTSDASGKWELDGVPLGTRMLEVRAIGYYPERRPVDVVAEGQAVEVALATFEAVLDAVRVTADRVGELDLEAFAQRKRGSGMGRFFRADQLMLGNPNTASDLLRTMPGFVGDGTLRMRGVFEFGGTCMPDVYIDGHLMRGIDSRDLDDFVAPRDIAGIEVYGSGSPKPPQFDSGMSGCGSLVIWQKPASQRFPKRR